jgi:hypothetical protein
MGPKRLYVHKKTDVPLLLLREKYQLIKTAAKNPSIDRRREGSDQSTIRDYRDLHCI